ncbi:beta-ketoacyl synthase N-terminal-like domain-containing protein [Streptomyces sp. NPDC050617]|uniref:beta-ketoacyl synthase N-terminal-like domain-containing protein n=1 Tax=Streptomyces sp. NPDC050617 TaxID=3154628 RepID=UPI00342491C0
MATEESRALVISGWSAASPYGLGREAFGAGLRSGRTALAPLDRRAWPGPYDTAGLIPDFDVRAVLGKKGTRAMDRVTGIAVVTLGMLLERYEPGLGEDPERVGLVLGSSGSVQSIMDFTRDALTGEKPYHVDPALFPNTVLNRPAGQSAIRYGLKGPNTTLSGGAPTGLLALNYASRLLRRGHAALLLCGAVEEYSPQRARLAWAASREATPEPLGEGGALFVLERAAGARAAGRPVLARVAASRFRAFTAPDRAGAALAHCVEDVLRETGTAPGDVTLVAPSQPPGPLGKQEAAALTETVGDRAERLCTRPLLGDAYAAAAAFQTAAVLSAAEDRAAPAALITSVDPDSGVGCTLLTGVGGRP